MKVNGHELEMKYLRMVNELKRAKQQPHWSDWLWVNKFRRKLSARLEKLNQSYKDGFLDKKAYAIWKSMINQVL